MVRTQVQLPEQQFRALRAVAARRGVSMAELLRQAVETLLRSSPPPDDYCWARASAAIGLFNSGLGDLAEEHDRYLDEAFDG